MPAPRPDLVVIGLDPAGLDLAMAAALIGARAVVVSQGEAPLDFAWASGEMTSRIGHWLADQPQGGMTGFRAHLTMAERDMAAGRSFERLRALGVRVVEAPSTFLSGDTLLAADEKISARRFVIATGRRPAPTAPLQADPAARTLVDLLRANALPDRLAIVGGQPEALVIAQVCRRLGAAVTLFDPGGWRAGEEPEAADLLTTALEREGIAFADAPPAAVDLDLPAMTAHLAGLGLDQAGIVGTAGALKLRPSLATTNRRVFAIGAVASPTGTVPGGAQQVPMLLRRLMLGLGGPVCDERLRFIATDPAIAAIGMTEAVARQTGERFELVRQSLPGEPGAGLIKLLVGRGGRILGVTIIHRRAAELIAPWALAIGNRLPVGRVAARPTVSTPLAEADRAAAAALARRALASPFLGRLARFVRLFP